MKLLHLPLPAERGSPARSLKKSPSQAPLKEDSLEGRFRVMAQRMLELDDRVKELEEENLAMKRRLAKLAETVLR